MADAIGDRLLMFDNSGTPSLELLRFHPDLADGPGFEAALREQVQRLAPFQHPAFARVRSVQRLEPDGDLALVSNHTPGKRLSEVLHRARGPAFAAALIRQLAPALAEFQQQHPGSAHGLLSPERIVVSPEARLTIVEHVVGAAIDRLEMGSLPLRSMGIALPFGPGGALARLDVATDWYQLGLVALAALRGRPVNESELPQLDRLLDHLSEAARREGTPLSPVVRQWLDRTLQVSGERIESGTDARDAVADLLNDDGPPAARRVVAMRVVPSPNPPPVAAIGTPAPPAPVTTPGTTAPVTTAPVPRVRVTQAPPTRPHLIPTTRSSLPTAVPPAPERQSMPAPETTASVAPGHELESFLPEPQRDPIADPPPPRPAAAQQPEPVSTPVAPPSTYNLRSQVVIDPTLSPFEREVLAGRIAGASAHPTRPPDAASARTGRTVSLSIAAGIALFAIVEAGVIAWMARTPAAAGPVLAVETTPSGEHVVVGAGDGAPASLHLTIGPDLRWVRVTSPSTQGIIGGTGTANTAGTLRVLSPIALKVFEGSKLLGSTPGADLKLLPGRHELDLVNEALGYRLQHIVEIEPGQTLSIHVTPTPGSIAIDALEGTDVSIDGQVVGRTPLGPLVLSPGEHQVVLRHSKKGSDRQRVVVKSGAATTVVAKLR